MHNNIRVYELEAGPEAMPKRSFITNRKTQLVLNVVLVIIIVILIVLISKKEDELERRRELVSHNQFTTVSINPNTADHYDTQTNRATPNTLMSSWDGINFIDMSNWIESYPNCSIPPTLRPTIEIVIIAHTATYECLNETMCTNCVRLIQKVHHDEKLCDIKYNFLIGGDGIVYIGRGWNKHGAHTKNQNSISISIALIGNFEYAKPNSIQIEMAQRLIEFGVRTNKLDSKYVVYPEKYFSNTESPGRELVKIIRKWPHYCNP